VTAESASSVNFLIGGAGMDRDEESNQYLSGVRYIQGSRWTSEDRSGFQPGDTNLMRIVANDPVDYVDPTGFQLSKPGQPSNQQKMFQAQQILNTVKMTIAKDKALSDMYDKAKKAAGGPLPIQLGPTLDSGTMLTPNEAGTTVIQVKPWPNPKVQLAKVMMEMFNAMHQAQYGKILADAKAGLTIKDGDAYAMAKEKEEYKALKEYSIFMKKMAEAKYMMGDKKYGPYDPAYFDLKGNFILTEAQYIQMMKEQLHYQKYVNDYNTGINPKK
jgi:RHS repeat-associated protein